MLLRLECFTIEQMNGSSKILAIETSSRNGSVAIATGNQLLKQIKLPPQMRHAIELMPAIDRLLSEAGWRPADLNHLYVSTGPGSFTGLRISITIVRSLAQITGAQVVAVPTLDAVALNAPPDVQNLAVILDAKRGQVFAARYVRQNDQLVRTWGPGLIEPDRFTRETPFPVTLAGEGVDYHRTAVQSVLGESYRELPRELWFATAAGIHAIGLKLAANGDFTPWQRLLPTYIRLAEAEEVWRKKNGLPI